MIREILILLILATNTNALNDINITSDGGTYEICLTRYDNNSQQTCNLTQIITLEGERDHFLEFTPKKQYSEDPDLMEWALLPFSYITNVAWGVVPIFILIGGGLIGLWAGYLLLIRLFKYVGKH